MCLLASVAWAVDITFVAGIDNGDSDGTAHPFSIEKDGIQINISNGIANSNQYRVYKNGSMTVISTIGSITKIVIECTAETGSTYGPDGFGEVVPPGYTTISNIGEWVGNSDMVTFYATKYQVRITKITVTVGQDGFAAPTIRPASGTYYHPVDVSITCLTPEAKIYYTTDGSTPTTASTEFTAPFTLSANTTVKAISVLDGNVSNVVSANYVILSVTPVQNIWESLLLADGTPVQFNNPVQVVYQRNNYLYVRDESAYTVFFGSTHQTYKSGDFIPAGFVGTMSTYNCERELKDLLDFSPSSGNTPIDPELITADQIGHNTFAHLVKLGHVIFSLEGNSYYVTDMNGNRAAVYFNMGVSAPSDLSIPYDVIGVVGSHYNSMTGECIYQLLPINILGGPPPQDVTFTAIYQSTPYLFVKVHEGGSAVDPGVVIPLEETEGNEYNMLVYGRLTNSFVNGDVIVNPQYTVTEYAGNKQFTPVDETFVVAYHGDPVEPVEMPIEEISQDMNYWYLIFRGVDFTGFGQGIEPSISDDSGVLPIYNRFNPPVTIYHPDSSCDVNEDGEVNIADVNNVIGTILFGSIVVDPLYGKYDVTGFLTVYRGLLQLYPVSIVYHANRYITLGDVNGDGEINIADVNVIIDYIITH